MVVKLGDHARETTGGGGDTTIKS